MPLWFLVHPRGLVLRREGDGVALPAEDEAARLGARADETPKDVLVDGGFAQHEPIEVVSGAEMGCTVYAPVPAPKDKQVDRYAPKASDSPAVAAWRERMAGAEAKAIYKERAATAECVNAQARNRGLLQLRVRGQLKAKAIALWHALAHNLMRSVQLRAAAAGVRAAAAVGV